MCWEPCVKISDVTVSKLSYVATPIKGAIVITDYMVSEAIKKSIPESSCDKEKCRCQIDEGEPKKHHTRERKDFQVTVSDRDASASVKGECTLEYDTQNGICEPYKIVSAFGTIPEMGIAISSTQLSEIPPESLAKLSKDLAVKKIEAT